MRLFTRESAQQTPPEILNLVPDLIAETNKLLRTGFGKPGYLIERLVEGGDVRRFNPNGAILREWMGSLPGVLTDGELFDPSDIYLQIVRRGRERSVLFKSHEMLGTGADLRSYRLKLHPTKRPKVIYVVKQSLTDPLLVTHTALPDRDHFRWTQALLATASGMP